MFSRRLAKITSCVLVISLLCLFSVPPAVLAGSGAGVATDTGSGADGRGSIAAGQARSVLFLQQELLGRPALRRGLSTVADNLLVYASEVGFALTSGGGRWKVHFTADARPARAHGGRSAAALRIDDRGRSLGLALRDARAVPGKHRGSKVWYDEVLPGVRLEFQVATDGVKESIVLKRALKEKDVSFRFALETAGLEPRLEGGQVLFYDEHGLPRWYVPRPFMVDAAGAVSAAVRLQLGRDGEAWFLEIVPDAAWLSDPARCYPVVIDPSLALWPGQLGWEPYWRYFTLDLDDAGSVSVNLFNGNLVVKYQDLYFTGQGSPTFLTRTYNSQSSVNGLLGYGWVHNYFGFLLENADGTVTYTDDDGTEAVFTPNGDGTYAHPPGIHLKLTRTTDPSGQVLFLLEDVKTHEVETYDVSGNLIRRADRNGNTTVFTYQDGALVSITDASGQVTTFTPSADGGILTATDPAGKSFTYSRDAYGNLVLVVNPAGDVVQMSYDAPRHLLLSVTDARGRTTSFAYDAEGRVVAVTDQEGNVWRLSYDPANRASQVITPRGEVYAYRFGELANCVEVTEPGGLVTTYGWDADLNLAWVTDPKGATTTYTYDDMGNRLTETDPHGKVTRFEYDADYNLVRAVDAESSAVQVSYDANHNPLTVTDSAGSQVSMTYDQKGNTKSVTDGNGNTTYYYYDERGNLIRVEDPEGGVATYGYDSSNNLVSAQLSRDGTVYLRFEYAYDALGRLVRVTDAKGQSVVQSYDANGNLAEVRAADGATVRYTYSGTNQVLEEKHGGVTRYGFAYDANGNRVSMAVAGLPGPYSYAYNEQNRLASVTEPWGNRAEYSYDAAGNVTGVTFTAGGLSFTVSYGYDAKGRLTAVSDGAGQVALSYGANDRLAQVAYPGGVSRVLSYDAASKVTRVEYRDAAGTVLYSEDYAYDGEGNKTRVTYRDGTAAVYTYDRLNRLTSETDPETGRKTVYQYDPAGNRTAKLVYAADGTLQSSIAYGYNRAGELVSVDGVPYQYDARGNLVDDGSRTYVWDAKNRLIEVREKATGNLVAAFSYDGDGRRISQTTVQGTVYYHYDGRHVAYETDGAGNITLAFTYDQAGIPLTMRYQGETYYYRTNDRGDVLALADAQGNVVASYRYDAWGNILEASGPLAQFNPYRYAGYRYDVAIGLYFLKARYYNAVIGKFLTRDSILGAPRHSQTLNTYLYATNDPVRYVDPDGRWILPVVGAVVGGIAGYAVARSQGWGTTATVAAVAGGALLGATLGYFAPAIASTTRIVAWQATGGQVLMKYRASRGADGAVSRIVKFVKDGTTEAVRHEVWKRGTVIHTHWKYRR